MKSSLGTAVFALLCATLVTSGSVRAANLVPNGDFESYTSCPPGMSWLYLAVPWVAPTTGSSDYLNACAPAPPAAYCGVPLNGLGYQVPHSGSGYGGMIVQNINILDYREYLEAPLSSSLVAGATYNITFYVSLANLSDYAISRIGAYVCAGAVGPINNYLPLLFVPQVENPAGSFLTDTLGWTAITGNFVATGGEDHIILGNFHSDDGVDTLATGGPFPSSYYYVDDVSLTPVAPTPIVVNGLPNVAVGVATIGLNPATQQLQVANIGSSGLDGVSIAHADGSNGFGLEWGDYDTDFAAPGCTHTHVLAGTVAGAAAQVPVVKLSVVSNSDGSETLSPDFSAVHPASLWVEFLDAAGRLLRRDPATSTWNVKVTKAVAAALKGMLTTQSTARERHIRLSTRDDRDRSAEVRYNGPVVAQAPGVTIQCSAIRMGSSGGDAVVSLGASRVTASWPQGSPPGSFSLAAEETDPPCAGLDCPNGPGTGTSLQALGNTLYLCGGQSGTNDLTVVPSDPTLPIGLHVTPSGCCTNEIKGLAMVTSGDASSSGTASSLTWEAEGPVAGTATSLGHATAVCAGGVCNILPDFSSVGASGYHVVLSQGGALVADVANPPDGLQLPASAVTDGRAALSIEMPSSGGGGGGGGGGAMLRIICITSPCPGWPVTSGGSTYLADRIDLVPSDPAPGTTIAVPDDLSSLDVSASGFPSLTDLGSSLRFSGTLAVPASAAAAEFARPQLSPNPSADAVRVVFALPRAGRARVSVIDATGRSVRGIADGTFAAGAHNLSWDGRDDLGRRAAPGVYFVRVESGQQVRVARVTRLW